MMLPKHTRLRDRRWLDAQRDEACWACGSKDGTVVAAHVRAGNEGGTSLKPDDALAVPLCFRCHASQENSPGAWWWFQNVFKRRLRLRYETWKRAPAALEE